MNHGTIAGHLGADPEVRFTSSGQKVTTFRVAARARKKEETIWWRVSVWGEAFDKIIPYFKKGSPIIVFGDINKPEMFTDREGKSQISMSMTAHHVSFSPFGRPDAAPGESTGDQRPAAFAGAQASAPAYGEAPASHAITDDEVPF